MPVILGADKSLFLQDNKRIINQQIYINARVFPLASFRMQVFNNF